MKKLNQIILKASSLVLLAFCITAANAQQLKSLSGANSPNDDTNPVWIGNNTLFFTRAFHPKNIGGKSDPGDIWMTKKDQNGVWTEATHRPDLSSTGYDLVLGLEDVLTLLVLRIENNSKTIQQYSKFGQEWNLLRTVNFPGLTRIAITVRQLTKGDFDVNDFIGFSGDNIIVTRTDMNHAAEIYSYNLKKKTWLQITKTNDEAYAKLALPKYERRYVTTTDGKKMLVWVILPPNFDKNKKYPALLYCQGGPQSPLTQSYSFRWNFSLMASQGYVVVAPNRRGMYGHGQEWNEQISKDWGGQVMDDYLSAIDDVAKESYVDKSRLGAVGASYGGYSVFYLAGIHNNRFKTFISHCGVFNLESMYGTTEEVFFNNWDHGGAYWEKDNAVAQKTYTKFNPIKMVDKWNTPILIIQGGKDYRVPIGQGQEAFQAAQLRGIKSRFMLFPEENHWVLKPQNALVWQREFYKWLNETL